MKRRFFYISWIIFLLLGSVVLYFYPKLIIATGYSAKKVCSCIFATGREIDEVKKNEMFYSILPFIDLKVDTRIKSVISTFKGLSSQTAIFREGFGCILLDGKDNYNVQFPSAMIAFEQQNSNLDSSYIWNEGLTHGTNKQMLDVAIENAFDVGNELNNKRTTSVLVIHNDTIIGERYASPFSKDTPQLGWSMTKSMMNTFIGMMVMNGKLDVLQHNLFPEWAKDNRKNITLHNLLQMNSGLTWDEDYTSVSDATTMLYKSEDISLIARQKELKHDIGEHWYYSSGSSNLISKFIRNYFRNDSDYHSFLKRRLFDPLEMKSAFIEPDESGTFIMSSYGYATPRDWAKFGLLYLNNGVWNGKRLLPEQWIDYTTANAKGSEGKYGAHFWLNLNGVDFPNAPHDMFYAAGHQGQYVFIIPSKNIVIVRMGTDDLNFDANSFVKEVLASIAK